MATNAYQAAIFESHGLHERIVGITDKGTDSLESRTGKVKIGGKHLADTMGPILGAVYIDVGDGTEGKVEVWKIVRELGIDIASLHDQDEELAAQIDKHKRKFQKLNLCSKDGSRSNDMDLVKEGDS